MTFEDFQLDEQLMEGLHSMGFKTPSPVQQQAIPLIMQGRDIIACAQTGTGKTAAYLLPTLHKLMNEPNAEVSTLIIAPTRELALQIDQQIEALSYFCSVSSIAVYGGGDGITWEQQKRALKSGTDIVTCTPGRLIAMLSTEGVKFDGLKYLILDEADRMLDMGFYDDIVRIINELPTDRQTLLFSATMPPRILQLTKKILKDPAIINIAISKPAEKINQMVYQVYDTQKESLLMDILKSKKYDSVIIFAGTKDLVKRLGAQLERKRIKVKAFHSDLEQAEREAIMQEFKSGRVNVLVGTDILSRGIDVEGIDLVVNYDVPGDAEDYIHRIGRTARAAAEGTAITFVNPKDQGRFQKIEKLMDRTVARQPVPEYLGETPALNAPREDRRPDRNRPAKNRPPQANEQKSQPNSEGQPNKKRKFKKKKRSGNKRPEQPGASSEPKAE